MIFQQNREKFEIWLIDIWPPAKGRENQYLARMENREARSRLFYNLGL